jgi:class 3 adenylate cyclase
MKCTNCEFENREGAKFCKKCGGKLALSCPSCSHPCDAESLFCDECGQNLAVVPSAAPPKDFTPDDKLAKIQRYLPQGLAEKILSQRDKIEGERKQVTVMFCDLAGYTSLAERLDPEETYQLMDSVYELLIHGVQEYQGTVNEMTGDGVLALFGAPIALEDAPQRAVRSALSIQREIARKATEKGLDLRMRIGIHTGPVVVGTLGNDLRVEFKAVGDTVNVAARIEQLAEPGSIWVTGATHDLVEGLFRCEGQDRACARLSGLRAGEEP